jgi:hypothetical protein
LNSVDTLISTIPAKKRRQFVDPYQYKENADLDEVPNATASQPKLAGQNITDQFSFTLGNKKIQDEKGGDAGCLYKLPEVMPSTFFIRAVCVAKASSTMIHSEMH